MQWYQKSAYEVLNEWKVRIDDGLSYDDVARRLKTYGANQLAHQNKENILLIFARQFKSPLIYILIFAAVLVIILGNAIDSLVILAVITINAVVGTIQEGKAKNSLERLRSLTRHRALVRRGGKEILVSSEEVVVGDILILKEGDRVTADARIVASQALRVDESILTGEAYSVGKKAEAIKKEGLVLGDQKNMVFSGTSVVSGNCEAVVVQTGMNSEIGKISKDILETSQIPLPLAKKVLKLTHFISIAVLLIALATLAIGLLRGIGFIEILGAVIGLSVSIVPEGLPVAVTIVLAGGVWRMARQKAIVRQLAAVEAMGNADALLIDKTGTITTGKMVIKHVFLNNRLIDVSGNGYSPKGKINTTGKSEREKLDKILGFCFMSLSADVVYDEHFGWKPSGDPTEAAIAALCRRANLSREKLSKLYKADFARPFDVKKRYLEAAFVKESEKWHILVGAPEFLSKELKIGHDLLKNYHNLASRGLRVVGVALYGPGKNKLYGWSLLAIEEEIREEVAISVGEAKRAGFRVVMMSGDYAETAKAIAKKVGIYEEGDRILTGEDVEKLAEVQLAQDIENVSVFARITPEHKLKIVEAFKKRGYVCAMTGDGVNDAPALQAANLGIGLGSGTQVAKDSSDIVLVDDNFKTIVDAIGEGRAIYLSLKENILYLFSTSFGEVLVILGAILVGLPLPLVAVQIIWLNFVTDGFFVVALAQDPPSEKQLKSSADVNSQSLVDRLMVRRMILMGFSMMVAAMPIFIIFSNLYSVEYARSMVLVVLSVLQWFNALNVRSRVRSVFEIPINNGYLIFAFFAVAILQYLAIQTKLGNQILHTQSLAIGHWILAVGVSTLIIWVEEVRKLIVRSQSGK